jgi:hypothetical protein
MSPWCLPWCMWSNMVPEEKRLQKRREAMPMVDFCIKVAMYQVSKERFFIIENPHGSAMWNLEGMLGLSSRRNVTWQLLHMCAWGLKDPESGLPYKKGMYLMHNLPAGSISPLFRLCKGDHQHQIIEGSSPGHSTRSQISEVYPWRFCRQLARLM